MPPAAPPATFPPGMSDRRPMAFAHRRLAGTAHAVQPRRKAKPEGRKRPIEFSDVRIARRIRGDCDEEERQSISPTETTPRRRTRPSSSAEMSDKPKSPSTPSSFTEMPTDPADGNLSLSGAEDTESEEMEHSEMRVADYSPAEDSSSDDDDIPESLQRKRKFYIVANAVDGRPAEVYRTDLIHRMRNGEDESESSDDEYEGPSMLRLTDRWREEWNHGVQVPLNSKQLPPFKALPNDLPNVKHEPFKLPAAYISRSAHRRIRLYEGDRLDEVWLTRLNASRAHRSALPVSFDTLLDLMDEFEVECYKRMHRKLLDELEQASPLPRGEGDNDDAPCDICRLSECDEEDEMVFCDTCNVCVHQSCYGLQQLPVDSWYCNSCVLCYGHQPPCCVLCPSVGGAMKCTKNGDAWVHIACALWIPECRFENVDEREPISNIEGIPDERWQLKCSICDTRQGACIQCSHKQCHTAFHVTCAQRAGLEMRIEEEEGDGGVLMICMCEKHTGGGVGELTEGGGASTAKMQAATSCASDEEAPHKRVSTRADDALSKLEQHFYLYVQHEEVAKRLAIEPVVASDVYEYWKLRRAEAGRSLITNGHDEIAMDIPAVPQLDLPGGMMAGPSTDLRSGNPNSPSKLPPLLRKWALQTGRVIKSLDMARNVATITQRREKLKWQMLTTEWDACRSSMDACIVGDVPVSDRSIVGVLKALEAITDADDYANALRRAEVDVKRVDSAETEGSVVKEEEEDVVEEKEVRKSGARRSSILVSRAPSMSRTPSPRRRSTRSHVPFAPFSPTSPAAHTRSHIKK